MRCSLPDLLIAIAASGPGWFLGLYLTQGILGRMSVLPSFLLGVVTYLVITSPLYRWFQLRPLWMPRCPHCRHKDRFYYRPRIQPDWPVGELVCAKCGKMLELWYDDPHPIPPDRGLVRFQLVWPYSFGRWRQLPAESKIFVVS